jgi:Tfp pilus assembly PilM family ATPase
MFSQKEPTSKTVLRITDTEVSYLTLKKNNLGFFVDTHEQLSLVEGAIVQGEILMADFLYKVFKKISLSVENKNIDVILAHEYFLCHDVEISKVTKKQSLKKRVTKYFKELSKEHSWQKTHVCEFSSNLHDASEKILFTCLPKEIFGSYLHVLEKAGFKISSMNSDILAFDHVLPKERASIITIADDELRMVEFKNGVYSSYKKFQVSYSLFTQDIMKSLNVSTEVARKIFDEYGILRAHKDEKVYKRLIRSLSPLLDFLSKRKIKERSHIRMVFTDTPIRGFVDVLQKTIKSDVAELDILRTGTYSFQDVLSLHRNESYKYQSHIAQALKAWKR